MRLMRRSLCLICVILLCSSTAACGGNSTTPADLMQDFISQYGTMPAGQLYTNGCEEWEDGFLSPSLIDSLYTEDNGENAFSLCRDYAIYLATSQAGGEIAIFRCSDRASATRVSEMCYARIKRARAVTGNSGICEGACVIRRGTYVVLLMLPDNIHAKEICTRLL